MCHHYPSSPISPLNSSYLSAFHRCTFPESERGIEGLQDACHKAKLFLRYKRFVFDPNKRMIQ